MNRTLFILLFAFPCLAFAQRGVDLRNWPEKVTFSETQVYDHLSLMALHNIEEVSIDGSVDQEVWKTQAQKVGLKIHTGNQRFGQVWLQQCQPLEKGGYDSANCVDGLVNSDLRINDALFQLKKDYQPIQFSWAGEKLTIHKVSDRFELRDLKYEWQLMADGKAIESGWFSIDEDSLRAKVIELSMKTVVHDKQFHYLEVYAKTNKGLGVIPEGHEVAKEQFELSVINKKPLEVHSHSKLVTTDKKDRIELSGANFQYTIDRNTGHLSSMIINEEEQLSEPFRPSFHWPADDLSRFKEWRNLEKELSVSDVILELETPYLVKITALINVGDHEDALTLRYQIFSTGDIRYTQRLAIADTMNSAPRFGVMMNFSSTVDSLSWFGRGPQINYGNANSAAFVGMNVSVDLSGVRSEVNWAALTAGGEHFFLAGEPDFTLVVPEDRGQPIGVFTREKSSKTLPKPTKVAGQEIKLRMRIRPFDPEAEKAWKLARFTVREMRPPVPKAMESRKHEVVK